MIKTNTKYTIWIVTGITTIVLLMVGYLYFQYNFNKKMQLKIIETEKQIKHLNTLLISYKNRFGEYPTTDEGIIKLIESLGIKREKSGGFLLRQIVPHDAWGNELIYIYFEDQKQYEIISYGADGKPGGEGINKDLSSLNIQ